MKEPVLAKSQKSKKIFKKESNITLIVPICSLFIYSFM